MGGGAGPSPTLEPFPHSGNREQAWQLHSQGQEGNSWSGVISNDIIVGLGNLKDSDGSSLN